MSREDETRLMPTLGRCEERELKGETPCVGVSSMGETLFGGTQWGGEGANVKEVAENFLALNDEAHSSDANDAIDKPDLRQVGGNSPQGRDTSKRAPSNPAQSPSYRVTECISRLIKGKGLRVSGSVWGILFGALVGIVSIATLSRKAPPHIITPAVTETGLDIRRVRAKGGDDRSAHRTPKQASPSLKLPKGESSSASLASLDEGKEKRVAEQLERAALGFAFARQCDNSSKTYRALARQAAKKGNISNTKKWEFFAQLVSEECERAGEL